MQPIYLKYLLWALLAIPILMFVHGHLYVLSIRQGFVGWVMAAVFIMIALTSLALMYPTFKMLYREHYYNSYDGRALVGLLGIWLGMWGYLGIWAGWLFIDTREQVSVSHDYVIKVTGRGNLFRATDYRLYLTECHDVYRKKTGKALFFSVDRATAKRLKDTHTPIAITHRGRTFFGYQLLPDNRSQKVHCPEE